jgi:molybdopterin molybdotransferase
MSSRVEDLIPLEEAQRLVDEISGPLSTEVVPLDEGYGRIIAEDVRAQRDEPSSPRVAMDGYAVRSEDVKSASPEESVSLTVVGAVSAGEQVDLKVRRGEAIRAMTGALLPEGADAVVPLEMTEIFAEGILVKTVVSPGDNLFPVGEEYRRGQHLVSRGTVLGPAELTVLAALGEMSLKVQRRPGVAVLATGSELVEVGQSLGPGQLFASNLHTLVHLVNSYGGSATSLGVAADKLDTLIRTIQQGLKADLVLTTGGTGGGEKDLVARAATELGGNLRFQGVAMSPGRQTLCAQVGGTLIFGLPGRPSATYVAFEQLVRPALFRMLGLSQPLHPEISANLTHTIQPKGKVSSFLFCSLTSGSKGPEVRTLRSERQGIFSEMLSANGLLKVVPGRGLLEKGELVRVQLLNLGLFGHSCFATT